MPAGFGPDALGDRGEPPVDRRGGRDVAAPQAPGTAGPQLDRIEEGRRRHGRELGGDEIEVGIAGDAEHARRRRRQHQPPALDFDGRGPFPAALLVHDVGPAPDPGIVGRHHRIEIDIVGDPLAQLVADAGDHAAGVAVTDQHEVVEAFELDQADDVRDMGRQPDPGPEQMRAVGQAGKRRREDAVSGRGQQARDARPAPAAMPGAVHQDEITRALVHGSKPPDGLPAGPRSRSRRSRRYGSGSPRRPG